jgi:hypothetical protein
MPNYTVETSRSTPVNLEEVMPSSAFTQTQKRDVNSISFGVR